MSSDSTHTRILFVIPDAAFASEGGGNRTHFIGANSGGLADIAAELISNLFEMGVDVHVAQPDFRKIFSLGPGKEKNSAAHNLPCERVHLAADRAFFYSNPISSNSEWENIKISLSFQREVLNQIIPRVQPDLIHCYGWMSGLIPAAAKIIDIPSLFTAHEFDTARSLLSDAENRGIDAAAFWEHLFYNRYPVNYEETRSSNPADLLLSGVFAAHFVTTSRSAFLANGNQDKSRLAKFPIWEVLVRKMASGCATVSQHKAKTQQYIDIYEKILEHPICRPVREERYVPYDSHPQVLNA